MSSDLICVCFDLGGVLARIRHTWGEAMQGAGVERGSEAFLSLPLIACPAFNEFQAGQRALDSYLVELGRFLGGINVDQALAVHQAILVGPYPGTHELVRQLHQSGFITGCLSNTNEPHWQIMRHSGAYPAISELHVPFASHEVLLEKPHPEIYRAFAARASVPPEAIAFFDDSQPNVDAAIREGWRAWKIDPEGDPVTQMHQLEPLLAKDRPGLAPGANRASGLRDS